MQVKSIADAILLTFIKLPLVIKVFVLSIFELPFYTGFTLFLYAILLTFIKLPLVIKVFVLSIFELPFYTGFTLLLYFVIIIKGPHVY